MVAVAIGAGGATTVRFGIEADATCVCAASNARISSVPFPGGIPASENSGLKNGIIGMDLRRSDSSRIGYITFSLPCGGQKRHNPRL